MYGYFFFYYFKFILQSSIKLFEEKKVRSIWNEEEQQWYFSVVDVVEVLTESVNPRDYWFKMKKRVHSEDGIELSTICRQLKMQSSDGKYYNTDCANVKSLFRIIQSIPSPKAEPFKQWLAQVGYERMQEIENPETFEENENVARRGGKVAGNARKETEKEIDHTIISSENYLDINKGDSDGTLPENNLSE